MRTCHTTRGHSVLKYWKHSCRSRFLQKICALCLSPPATDKVFAIGGRHQVSFAWPVDFGSLMGGGVYDPCSPTACHVVMFSWMESHRPSHCPYSTLSLSMLPHLEKFCCFGEEGYDELWACAHGEGRGERDTPSGTSGDEGQISPIFIQFFDCTFQIVNQYPECFEFNTKHLLVLSEQVYSSRIGTML